MKREGIRANLPQFALLVGMNALVGALIGQERSLIPLLAKDRFGLTSAVVTSAFLVTFGLTKAPSNLIAGILADRIGRKRVMQIGWLFGLPVPFILMGAGGWGWVLLANALLGINQGFTWSTTVLMKIDLARDDQRGRAVGWNEAAGYTAVGVSALVSGLLAERYGLGFEPFVLGAAVAVAGLAATWLVNETVGLGMQTTQAVSFQVRGLLGNSRLLACARTGLVNNANDAFVWALLPLLLLRDGRSTTEIAGIAATYPIVWGLLQLFTGPLSDRFGRRAPITAGMALQATALVGFTIATSLASSLAAAVLLGLGTALAYPALIAAAADAAEPAARASSVGFYRMWRDAGYAIGALGFGAVADVWGLSNATLVVAAVTIAAGLDSVLHLGPDPSPDILATQGRT